MRIILDIATLLGGIAALCYFGEQLSKYLLKRRRTGSASKSSQQPLSLLQKMILAGFISGICGIVIGLIGMKFGSWWAVFTFVGCLIMMDIATRFDNVFTNALMLGAIFMVVWSFTGLFIEMFVGVPLTESTTGTLFTIGGGVVGIFFGAYIIRDSDFSPRNPTFGLRNDS